MYHVMSGGRFGSARAFSSNAVGIETLAEAERVAAERNAVERKAGRSKDDVLWFATETIDFEAMLAKIRG